VLDAAPSPDPASAQDAGRWLASSPLLDLEDPKLRLKAHALTQLCKTEREKALAVYGFVKRIPFAKPFKMRLHTAREVIDAGRGDAPDKATLLVALLRLAGLPARIRYVTLRGEILRGLTSSMSMASRPLVEIWLNQRWVGTDSYIFDAGYMAAARARLKEQGWEWGYGIHVNGHAIWDGVNSCYVGGVPTGQDPMVVEDLRAYRDNHPRLARALHWNVLSPVMERAIRDLRHDAVRSGPLATRKSP
jgi:hypothetical protein